MLGKVTFTVTLYIVGMYHGFIPGIQMIRLYVTQPLQRMKESSKHHSHHYEHRSNFSQWVWFAVNVIDQSGQLSIWLP